MALVAHPRIISRSGRTTQTQHWLQRAGELWGRNVLRGLIPSMPTTLFTVGYVGRSIEDFIALLERHKMTALCDVRSMPYSSRNPQFNREPLKKALKSHSIEYVFLGEELGARPKDSSCYVDEKAIYQKIAATTLFKMAWSASISVCRKVMFLL